MSMSKNKKKEVVIVKEEVEMPNVVNMAVVDVNRPQLSFDAWWILAQRKHKLSPSIKKAVYLHFRARGFLDSKSFDEGLVDFGVKS
jgi:hypothetical protein